ncbi:MAG: hypothetical protein AB1758_12760, partial [Candidatus Eremiobacterota bacterium]
STRTPWRLVVDDAKHYLATTSETYDLIIIDVPAPYYLQTGLLFTREFYALCRGRLSPEGILSVYLAEDLTARGKNPIAGPILAAVAAEFPNVSVVNGYEAGYGFAYASRRRLDVQQLWQACVSSGGREFQNVPDLTLQKVLAEHRPASLRDLRLVWRLSWDAFPR